MCFLSISAGRAYILLEMCVLIARYKGASGASPGSRTSVSHEPIWKAYKLDSITYQDSVYVCVLANIDSVIYLLPHTPQQISINGSTATPTLWQRYGVVYKRYIFNYTRGRRRNVQVR